MTDIHFMLYSNCFNPLGPNGDQHKFSLNNIHMLSRKMVMRVNTMITKEKILWSVIKLSQLILKGNVWRAVWRICMWIVGLEGFFKLKIILLTNLQSKSNNSFHRTYLRVAHVCSEKGKDPGLTLNSECPLVSPWISKCSRQTGKIRFWKVTNEIYRLTSRNISLVLFCDDFRNRRKTHTLWGGTKLYS